jgi:hypothetical protein
MHSPQTSLLKPPYGLSFSIEDLIAVRSWAEQRNLRLGVATDQVVDGAEFEEMLILAPKNRDRRTLTLWRTYSGLYAQTPHGRPRQFATVAEMLESIRPVPKRRRSFWRFLGFASAE